MTLYINLFKPIEFTTPRMNPSVNYELWIMCVSVGSSAVQCIAQVGSVDSGRQCMCVGRGYMETLYFLL